MTQEDRVLKWLKTYKKITVWEAIREFGATRLSAIIYNLRNKGYNITTTFVTKKNRFDEYVTFGEYELKENDDDKRS